MKSLIILDSERRTFPTSNKILSELYKYLEDKYLKTIYTCFIIPKIKKIINKENTKIIALDRETEVLLAQERIPFYSVNHYVNESDFERYWKFAIDFVRRLPNSFTAIDVKYLDVSLWKTDELHIYESFFKPIITHIEIIKKIISVENPFKLILFNSSSRPGMIQKMFKNHIEIEDNTDAISKFRKAFFNTLMPFAVKTIYSEPIRELEKIKYKPKKPKKIMFFGSERSLSSSLFFLDKISTDVIIIQDGKYSKKIHEFNYDLIENYINEESKQRLLIFKKMLINSFCNLQQQDKSNLKYKGIPIFKILEDLFEYLFNVSYLVSAFYCECFNTYFYKNKPKLVIVMGELPKKYKIAIDISKKHSIKSLLIMHGTFGTNYLCSNIVADKIVLFGHHYKEIFRKLGNDEKKMVVTGNPAWDYLATRDFNRKKLIRDLKLPKDKKFILLATIPFPFDRRYMLAYSVIRSMTKLPFCHLIIKLHPEEKPDFYKQLLDKYKLKATIVDELSLLHPLISISELVIMSNSTVGLETLLLNKPLIDVNLGKEPYYQDYIDKKVALGVRREADLIKTIKLILYKKKVRENLVKKREKYIYEHAYKQDGKASERILKLIKSMLK